MKFERFEKKANGESGGAYLKLKDGETINGVFRGEILKFWQIWPRGGDKQIFADPQPGASPRFKINIVVHENGGFVAKVFEFPKGISNQLAGLQEDYDLSKTKVKITRHGTEKNTTYIIIPSKDQPSAAQMKVIAAVELNTLSIPAEVAPAQPLKEYTPSDDDDEVPF